MVVGNGKMGIPADRNESDLHSGHHCGYLLVFLLGDDPMKRIRQLILVVLLAVFSLSSTGCIGTIILVSVIVHKKKVAARKKAEEEKNKSSENSTPQPEAPQEDIKNTENSP